MAPDVTSQVRAGWIACAIAAGLVLLVPYLIYDSEQADAVAALKQPGSTRGQALAAHIAEQQRANDALRASIEELKKANGFTVSRDFTVLKQGSAYETQPKFRWVDRFSQVQSALRTMARAKGTAYDPMLGFRLKDERDVPPEPDIPDSLGMLQLVDKAMRIALSTPQPMESIGIKLGELRGKLTGPVDRPELLREYRIELTLRGSVDDVLWMIHQYAQTAPVSSASGSATAGAIGADATYPLIITNCSITSDNKTSKDDLPILTAKLELAGMRFVPDSERGLVPIKASGSAISTPTSTFVPGSARP